MAPQGDFPIPYEVSLLREARPARLPRGDPHRREKTPLTAGWPAVLGAATQDLGPRPRLALAAWLTRGDHPLTARVWVNYVWQQHFGRGLVESPGDFGVRGTPPTHSELLDWLAAELIERGWSTRHIHRLIVQSAAYRQASRPYAENQRLDPENRFLWRWRPRRLEAEALRDATLAVTGELDAAVSGPSVPPAQGDTSRRRSVYLRQVRDDAPEMQRLFDASPASESCPRRHVSTVPGQSLYLLNSDWAKARRRALAQRVEKLSGEAADASAESGDPRAPQIEIAFRLVLGRGPDAEERSAAEAFFDGHPERDRSRQLEEFVQTLLNSNEFAYLE